MAKDFGSSEDWVNDDEMLFRGKKTASHKHKYLENEFLYLYGLLVLKFEMLQILKQ